MPTTRADEMQDDGDEMFFSFAFLFDWSCLQRADVVLGLKSRQLEAFGLGYTASVIVILS